jgi:hypothetical protein
MCCEDCVNDVLVVRELAKLMVDRGSSASDPARQYSQLSRDHSGTSQLPQQRIPPDGLRHVRGLVRSKGEAMPIRGPLPPLDLSGVGSYKVSSVPGLGGLATYSYIVTRCSFRVFS